ncbi:peptidase A4 family-domain-containing protein [Talaromyces proteolyticus]|uniref:Peptidase A4 family-domain-containing protein n=1 Tax=Talaromyces proteolyticus TaxID=1131652 RepID=A0AAD4L240_9EURO|nr:peptidase A4 family-domain-containing protein [Talaromyces proteolyticus]KAH8705216.1 peptidase A4 family-domain-containing protein [Talaromyces proteolyticus]
MASIGYSLAGTTDRHGCECAADPEDTRWLEGCVTDYAEQSCGEYKRNEDHTFPFGALLLAGSAVASPLSARVARRHGITRPNMRITTDEQAGAEQVNGDSQSNNWGGAVLVSSGFTGVSGKITVPTPKVPSGGDDSTQYCATAWVGIDGDTCQSAILQTGVDFCITGSQTSYDAWYEWIPANSIDFNNFSFGAGDEIEMSVVATSKTSGNATLTNNSNGQSVTHTFNSNETGSTLCETNAEWIVEDFTIIQGGQQSLAPFANFGKVTFTDSTATKDGSSVDATGADIITLVDKSGNKLATTEVDGSTVTVTYAGN